MGVSGMVRVTKRWVPVFCLLLISWHLACHQAAESQSDTGGQSEAPRTTQTSQASQEVVALGEIHTLNSTALGERRQLNIYFPPGYGEKPDAKYPVIYLLDGAVHEDYHHVTGLVQFLVTYNLMPQSIVVGIANVDRYRDFTYPSQVAEDKEALPTSGGSEAFRRFLAEELKPMIDREFPTDGTDTLIGQSLGGLLAAEIFIKTPDLFDHYMIVSPSFWWDGGKLLDAMPAALDKLGEEKKTVYVALGSEGPEMQAGVDRFLVMLKAGAPKNLTWHFESLPKETHATILHRALYRGFEVIYGETYKGM